MPKYLKESLWWRVAPPTSKTGTFSPAELKCTTSDLEVLTIRCLFLAYTANRLSMICISRGSLVSKVRSSAYNMCETCTPVVPVIAPDTPSARVTRMAYSPSLWLMAIGWWNKNNQCRKLKLSLTQNWSRPATNKSTSSGRKRKSLLFCWERKSWTSWLLTCCSKKGWTAEKFSKKGVNRKEKCFLTETGSSQTSMVLAK